MAATQHREISPTEAWVRGHLVTRFAAGVWWAVEVGVSVILAVGIVSLALHRDLRHLIDVAITGLVFIPVAREWPNWRRMARMLLHAT